MTLQSLKKHQTTRPNIYRWNSSWLPGFTAIVLTLGMNSFTAANEPPVTPKDVFTAQSGASTQTWEALKSRSAEKRWESISRERKRELKKQSRKERKEQRKSNTSSKEIEFVPEFRQIPDDYPTTASTPETKDSLSNSADSNKTVIQNSNIPLTNVAEPVESFKTIGLEEKKPATSNSSNTLNFDNQKPVISSDTSNPIVPVFPNTVPVFTETTTGAPKTAPTQKAYEDAAASPLSDDLALSTEDLEDEVPHLLKKIAGIKPFFDYEPDPKIAEKEPCRNLCPRPDGKPCKISENGEDTILECPKEFQLSREPYAGRNFSESIYTWEASNLNYRPLYFEDPNLERYGNSRKDLVQPFVSMGRFTGQLLALPYQMSIDPVRKKIYPLGYYRPGDYTPKRINGIPWNTKAAITQGLTATGLVFLLP